MISRLPAIAPRVANPIAVAIATIIRSEQSGGEHDDRVGHGAEARSPGAMIVEIGLRDAPGERRAQRREILRALAAQPARRSAAGSAID